MSLVSCFVWSQTVEPFKPGKLPKEEQKALLSGLTVRFLDAKGEVVDARRSRLAAFFLPAGAAPSPFFAPKAGDAWSARWTGYLKVPIRQEYQFQVLVRGQATLTVNDKKILAVADGASPLSESVELSRGYNKVEVDFAPPKTGDSVLRVSWVGEGFNLEPLPPESLFTRGTDADLTARTRLREGRLIFATHQCQRCHEVPAEIVSSADAMPELGQPAPSLENAGSRFGEAWLTRWIQNPRDLRPQATMPTVIHGETAPKDAIDIAAYLMTLRGKTASLGKGDAGAGGNLFSSLGCIACHHFNDPKEEEFFDRLPLHFVKEKYQPDAIVEFLKAPHRHSLWSRMPDFKLTDVEAKNLAAHVLKESKGKMKAGAAGDAGRGRKLFASVGCASCHTIDDKPVASLNLKRRPFPMSAAVGCLAADPASRKSAPDYAFDQRRREELRAFLAGDVRSLTRETPAEFSRRQVETLKCNACHRRDGASTRWFDVSEDEGKLPEILPLLTWAGEKLRPEWTRKLLAGGIDNRARPWLKARMPAFPARADVISLGLSHEHGFAPTEDNHPPHDPQLVDVGKKLSPQMGGLNCVQCHGVGKTPAVAPFEAPGINLLDAANRLRYSYYQRWMLDPPRLDPLTKMVKLAPDGKMTGIREVFDGDARRQFDALWHFIQTLPDKTLPDMK